jgi:alpha-ketoglutarate-dependent taurine dioxygenase
MDQGISKSLAAAGIALLPEYKSDATTETVAREVGVIVSVTGAPDIQILRPQERNHAPPNIYSGAYGTGEFPLHTDLAHWFVPPRYLLLRCITGSQDVATRLLDGDQVVKAIGAVALSRTLVQPRRPINGTRPLLRLLDRRRADKDRMRMRWDSLFTVPATRSSAAVFTAVVTFLGGTDPSGVVLARRGDTLIIDNWRIFHGRASVPSTAQARHIERVYLGSLQPNV